MEPSSNEEVVEDKKEDTETNQYARRVRVGRATIGRKPNYVESVGLGNLRVITTHGVQSNLRPE